MVKNQFKRISGLLSIALAVLIDQVIPVSPKQPEAKGRYFLYFLLIIGALLTVGYIASFLSKKTADYIEKNSPLIAGGILVLNIVNVVCSKFSLLPVLFFPSLDRVFGVFISDADIFLRCIASSGKLLLIGFGIGAVLGFTTGVLIGFNKTFAYWFNPLTKIIGPIPATSWSPLVLSLFSTSYQAAVFMIALSVWFPITVMTSSGIQNVQQTYFEVADTLGAGKFYKIFKVGIPASLPSVFLGFFYATTGSFVTLVTAEMFGCKIGIGWYLNWQKSMMLYANVYAGLILLAVLCNLIIKLLFVLRGKLLGWQKGIIKW